MKSLVSVNFRFVFYFISLLVHFLIQTKHSAINNSSDFENYSCVCFAAKKKKDQEKLLFGALC